MKERMPFSLDMDMLKTEATRASMHVEERIGENLRGAVKVVLVASNYVHSISVVQQLLSLIEDRLGQKDFLIAGCSVSQCEPNSSRICVLVAPSLKESQKPCVSTDCNIT